MELGHVVDNNQTVKEQESIFKTTKQIKHLFSFKEGRKFLKEALEGKLIISLFNQPSTRTRLKFELAGKYLGAEVSVINEVTHTSMVKGESWYNTLRTFSGGEEVDILTIRHPENLIPQQLAEFCSKNGFKTKIVSGGDGNHLHPTQGMGDVYTLKEHFGERFGNEKLKIAIGADLRNARVAHSLVKCLAHYPVDLTLASWSKFRMQRKYLVAFIKKNGQPTEVEKLPAGEKFDAIYWFRYQIEHGPKDEKETAVIQEQYNQDHRITPELLNNCLKEDGIFLHPGPRTKEIDIRIDTDRRVKDEIQALNGRFLSMALFLMMLNPNFPIFDSV